MVELSAALQNGDALVTLGALLLAVVLFISGAIAPELVGLLSVSLLMIEGADPTASPERLRQSSLDHADGPVAVSAALFRSGALDRLRELIASERIRSSRRMIGLLTLVVAPISGGPEHADRGQPVARAGDLVSQARDCPIAGFTPLSFATLLGGTPHTLGSSVNLLASDVEPAAGLRRSGSVQLHRHRRPVWLTGATYMLLAPGRLLPDRRSP